MGRTIEYVRVTDQELEQILAGNANDLLDRISDAYHGIDFALSERRLDSADGAERLDELCHLYSRCQLPDVWYEKVTDLGLSEDDLMQESLKRGLHFWLDLDKQHRYLEPLLIQYARTRAYGDPEDLLDLALYGDYPCPGGYRNPPSKYVSTPMVQRIAAFFNGTTFDELVEKYGLDPARDLSERAATTFMRLQTFYLEAAKASDGVLVYDSI